jgi:estrogen-related receptor beta like 1
MKQLRANITADLGGTKAHLNKIYTDIENTLDKIKTRETYLNRQLESSLIEYRSLQVSLCVIYTFFLFLHMSFFVKI